VKGVLVPDNPRGFVPDGRIGAPVADGPGPDPTPPDVPAKPMGLGFPVALTSPVVPATSVKLELSLNKDFQCRIDEFIPDS
jgi:hypothetical protein